MSYYFNPQGADPHGERWRARDRPYLHQLWAKQRLEKQVKRLLDRLQIEQLGGGDGSEPDDAESIDAEFATDIAN